MTSNGIVQKLWNYCNVLRDDGLSYGDYVEQLTYLLFLKMADEQSKPPFNRPAIIPKNLDWASLLRLDGDPLETQYRRILTELEKSKGTLGVIFRKAQNKIQDPANPQDKKNYDAIRILAEASLPGATDLFSDILQRVPTSQIPPAVGLDLLTLVKTKPELAASMQPAISRLEISKDKVGAAIQGRNKGRR